MLESNPHNFAVLLVRPVYPGIFLAISRTKRYPYITKLADEGTGYASKVLVCCEIRYNPVRDDLERHKEAEKEEVVCQFHCN